jgi:hypothetical protein
LCQVSSRHFFINTICCEDYVWHAITSPSCIAYCYRVQKFLSSTIFVCPTLFSPISWHPYMNLLNSFFYLVIELNGQLFCILESRKLDFKGTTILICLYPKFYLNENRSKIMFFQPGSNCSYEKTNFPLSLVFFVSLHIWTIPFWRQSSANWLWMARGARMTIYMKDCIFHPFCPSEHFTRHHHIRLF